MVNGTDSGPALTGLTLGGEDRQESKNHTCTNPLQTDEGCEGKERPAMKEEKGRRPRLKHSAETCQGKGGI